MEIFCALFLNIPIHILDLNAKMPLAWALLKLHYEQYFVEPLHE